MDRTEFSKRLNRIITPENMVEEECEKKVFPISEAIVQMMPSSLFRYRPCDESNAEILNMQIDAFRDDNIYAVTADKFNDPFDTLVKYDIGSIKTHVESLLSIETLLQIKAYLEQGHDFSGPEMKFYPKDFRESLKKSILAFDIKESKDYIENCKKQMLSSIDLLYPILSEVSKMFVTVACFCETVQSITMWSHYASSHRGFALEYDFRPTLTKGIENSMIYPVIYDDVRVDASSFMAYLYTNLMGLKTLNPDTLSHIRCSLHKAKHWEYEKEWRLLNYSPRDNIFEKKVSVVHYKPKAIYYGAKMSLQVKEQLHQVAREKGISEYEMYIDYSSPSYDMPYRAFKEFESWMGTGICEIDDV